eukprot:maker-scaffold1000_size72005-snap-gene-0.9 protein:Tk09937 transcript:maker-scaffold1000_size72005-snap-gene-0.9-mRNA-1 annotation:"anion exchange"
MDWMKKKSFSASDASKSQTETKEDLDRECNKIFHPERFDIAQFNPESRANVDERARQYRSNSHVDASELRSMGVGALASMAASMANEPEPSLPFFQRSTSLNEPPVTDSSLQRSQTSTGIQRFLGMDAGHDRQGYPHFHQVMSRLKAGKMKRAETDQAIRTTEHRKRPKMFSDVKTMPTIQDDDVRPEGADQPRRTKDHEGGSSEDEGLKLKTGAEFRIAAESSDDESGRVRRNKSREFTVRSDDEPWGAGLDRKVSFGGGAGSSHAEESHVEDDDDEKEKKRKRHKKGRRGSRHLPMEADLNLRRTRGSELQMEDMALPTEEDEANNLYNWDVEDMASHRMDHLPGYSRHKIKKGNSVFQVKGMPETAEESKTMNQMVEKLYGANGKELDRSPHDLFVEMDELHGEEWVEMARWIKYEEDREEGAERWGKAHISSLSFHSLINLRITLEGCAFILDVEARDMPAVAYKVVEEWSMLGNIEESQKGEVLRVLTYRHKYVTDHNFKFSGMKKNMSQKSLQSLLTDPSKSNVQISKNKSFIAPDNGLDNGMSKDGDQLVIDVSDETHLSNTQSAADLYRMAQSKKENILRKIKAGTEGTIVLVGSLDSITKPVSALVRLAEGIIMPNAMEVPLPVRFIFILLTPKPCPDMDFHEIGRSFSTLMSNPKFHTVCYKIEERRELLSAINEFLDESVVLPPGDWDSNNLLSINEIKEMRKRRQLRQKRLLNPEMDDEKKADKGAGGDGGDDDPKGYNPLKRTNVPFGGVINDIRKRYPWYWSDIRDGLNGQVLAATIFIYFACLSGAIAFGGLTSDKTAGLIGIPETLIMSAVGGLIFALFAGQPLIVTGVTGPVLLFDEALFGFTKSGEIDFLGWRVWISIWTVIIALLVGLFQGSTLVRFFTKFTKDIFASLVSLLFIFEALRKLVIIFGNHPLVSLDTYCEEQALGNLTALEEINPEVVKKEPNTALLSAILMFGTFFIAYFLRIFRNGKYMGRTIRRALGDFGVPIAIVIMVALDFFVDDTFTQKLEVPSGLQVTSPERRGWFIPPMGAELTLPVWAPFAAAVPAILLYLLLFMETHICELIMMEKTSKKGGGLHLDIILLSFINLLSAFLGGPWICAATVRAVAHVSALTVMSTTHAPGESPKVVQVFDQRVSGCLVSLMLGFSVLLAPALKLVPFAVLFGVFLYMGVSSINGIQMFDRIALILMPVKHHPQVSYVRRVKTWKMHLFTILQVLGLVVLWVVKSTQLALFFPFFVVAMIPYRLSLKFLFSTRELDALDGAKAGQMMIEDEPDFYDQAYGA